MMRCVRLLGLDLSTGTLEEAIQCLGERPPELPFDYVVTPNVDHFVRLSRARALRWVYDEAWLRLLDSRVLARSAWLLGLRPPRVVTGADLTEAILQSHLRPGERITIVGLRPDLLPVLVRRYRLSAPAHHYPPFDFDHDVDALAEAVRFVVQNPARFVFLAVGSPRQEMLAAAIKATGRATGIGLCVGASLDFLTGGQRRAPRSVQLAGLEWLFRLVREPRRLAGRYLCNGPRIVALLWQELRAKPAGKAADSARPGDPGRTGQPPPASDRAGQQTEHFPADARQHGAAMRCIRAAQIGARRA